MATIAELREQAKAAGIKGASRLNKADLETALGSASPATADTASTAPAAETGTSTPDNLSEAQAQKNASALGADEVQAAFDEANAKGYWGNRKDSEPDSTYAFPRPNERVA